MVKLVGVLGEVLQFGQLCGIEDWLAGTGPILCDLTKWPEQCSGAEVGGARHTKIPLQHGSDCLGRFTRVARVRVDKLPQSRVPPIVLGDAVVVHVPPHDGRPDRVAAHLKGSGLLLIGILPDAGQERLRVGKDDHLSNALSEFPCFLHGGRRAVLIEAGDGVVEDDHLAGPVGITIERGEEEGEGERVPVTRAQGVLEGSARVAGDRDAMLVDAEVVGATRGAGCVLRLNLLDRKAGVEQNEVAVDRGLVLREHGGAVCVERLLRGDLVGLGLGLGSLRVEITRRKELLWTRHAAPSSP